MSFELLNSNQNIANNEDIFSNTEAELALTHVTAKWGEARKTFKRVLDVNKKKYFELNLNFLTRAMVVVTTERALYEIIHSFNESDLIEGWDNTEKIINYLVIKIVSYTHYLSLLSL